MVRANAWWRLTRATSGDPRVLLWLWHSIVSDVKGAVFIQNSSCGSLSAGVRTYLNLLRERWWAVGGFVNEYCLRQYTIMWTTQRVLFIDIILGD